MNDKKNWSIDWLAFNYKNTDEKLGYTKIETFLEDFPVFKEAYLDCKLEKGAFGYRFGFNYIDGEHTVLLLYTNAPTNNTNVDLGVYVSFSGSALYLFEKLFDIDIDNVSLYDLFKYLHNHNCTLSRIDLKYDDFDKKYTPTQYAKWWLEDRIVTKFKKIRFVTSQQTCGDTFYMGNNKKLLRIYDKNYQSKGEINAIRYEFQLQSDVAKGFFRTILQGVDFDLFQWLRNDWFYIAEKSKAEYGGTSNYIPFKEWEEYIKNKFMIKTNEISIKVERPKSDYFKKKAFFENNLKNLFGLVAMVEGGSYLIKFLRNIELSPEYSRIIDDLVDTGHRVRLKEIV